MSPGVSGPPSWTCSASSTGTPRTITGRSGGVGVETVSPVRACDGNSEHQPISGQEVGRIDHTSAHLPGKCAEVCMDCDGRPRRLLRSEGRMSHRRRSGLRGLTSLASPVLTDVERLPQERGVRRDGLLHSLVRGQKIRHDLPLIVEAVQKLPFGRCQRQYG